MSYFNMVCDSCGREVYGCNIVNGMKFCAKCYQETFGETDKDKQIAELQKQLEGKNKTIQGLIETQKYLEKSASYQMFLDIQKQLEEKEKEIDEFKRIGEKGHISDLLEDKRKENKILVKTIEQTNQDKISFCIKQLEKVKGLIANHTQELWTCENDDIDVVLYEEIDKQINELKGNVE